MSANSSRIAVLAARISELTAVLDKYHIDTNTPCPSFEESYWKKASYPENVEQARIDLSDACRELDELVTGPRMILQNKTFPRHNYIDVVYNFDIASRVPKEGKISYRQLAEDIGVPEKPLRRLLRYAITNRVFREDEPGFISHSAASRVLAEDRAMVDWLGTVLLGVGPAADYHAAALKKWPQADDPAHAPVILAMGITEPSYFAYVAKTPDAARVFAGSMSLYLTDPGYSLNYLVNHYPWGEIGSGTVVDLGGSVGDAAFALADKFPQLNVIVQDQLRTIESARERPGVSVKFMVHDFFEEQPVKGADVYLCRWCLHNWPDKYAVRVLKALVPALKPGARILIMDGLVPPIGTTSNIEERALRGMDCGMMAVFNAGERELDEWMDLFASADSRYAFVGAKQPKGSKMALIEATWEPGRVLNGLDQ